MGSIEVKRSAQFDSFVAFAQKAMETGDTKAVARAGGQVFGADGLASRTIKPATTDKAFALFRSRTDKIDNNTARDLFRQSVRDMFGGEDRIPAPVKKAMLLKDYDVGKPLTARRIMDVKHAIEQLQNTTIKNIKKADAGFIVQFGCRYVNNLHRAEHVNVDNIQPENVPAAAALVRKYGAGLTEKGVGLLVNFTINLLANDPEGKLDHEAYVQRYAQDISKWRHFDPGDTRFAQVDKQFTAYSQGMVNQYLDAGMAHDFAGDLHKSFIRDAPRASYNINGQSFPFTPDRGPDPVINAFTSAVKDSKQRMVLSTFMSQLTGSSLIGLAQRMPLPPTTGYEKGLDLTGVAGSDMIISAEAGGGTIYRMPKTQVQHTTYTLNIAPDGKSAKVTVENSGNIAFALDSVTTGQENLVGRFNWKQEFIFDFSGDTPKIVSANIGQSFESSSMT